MPIVPDSSYRPPPTLRNGHLQTIVPALARTVSGVRYRRERIDTPDGDFLDLDWSAIGSTRLVVLSHGLEGNSDRSYMRGMARAANRAGWDALAWNFRGCSGELNRLPRFYHSGATEDLQVVVEHAIASRYDQIALVGFSLGGNMTLKYLGERALDAAIVGAVAFSVPCDLKGSSRALARPANRLYMRRFLVSLEEKIRGKWKAMPGELPAPDFRGVRTFQEFDDRFTAPMHGFRDAEDYWRRCSCRQFLSGIRVPTLLVSALDDPFLSRSCYPFEEAKGSREFHLETPSHGGHVGFIARGPDREYWSETRAMEFLGTLRPSDVDASERDGRFRS